MTRVSKEQAEKLKTLGYNEPCNRYYMKYLTDDLLYKPAQSVIKSYEEFLAPFQDEVLDWLDEKGYYVVTDVHRVHGKITHISAWVQYNPIDDSMGSYVGLFTTRTSAKSAGIDKALEILKSQSCQPE